MSFGKKLTLSNGVKIPQIGLGTWLAGNNEVGKAVEFAVRNGYPLKNVIPSVVKREDLFITSKLWNTSHRPADVEKELDETLSQLGMEYLDLYLMHWPIAFPPGDGLSPADPERPGEVAIDTETSLVDTWKAMIALPKSKVKAIGVSNFTGEHIKGITAATKVAPTVNQIEAHPLLLQDDLKEYCDSQNIIITAYSPLGNNLAGKPFLTDYEPIIEVAKRIGATPAQVLIAWGVHRGYAVIPKSVKEERILSNFRQVEISQEDYEKITSIGYGHPERRSTPITYKPKKWNINVFEEKIEEGARHKVKIH